MIESIAAFQQTVWTAYREHFREMPWRSDPSPYRVFVSEFMLQQTQVSRVQKKFFPFLDRFPGFPELAGAPLSEVLRMWVGLGYNRRAKFMQESAGCITAEHQGVLPRDPKVLQQLPGIGPATAGSIAAFAYNVPAVFVETNIRRVFIQHFFPKRLDVHDDEIRTWIEQTLPRDNAREWYWALMDYGVQLAGSGENANHRSFHYARGSEFAGSDRKLRGMVLRDLAKRGHLAAEDLPGYGGDEGFTPDRVDRILRALEEERFIRRDKDGTITLSE